MKTSRGGRSLARVSFESHVVSTFLHHLRVSLHPTDNLKLSNNRGTTQDISVFISNTGVCRSL